jgi:prenyltransferase beta subunit
MKRGFAKSFIILIILLITNSLAYSSPNENGVSWLMTAQNADGSWGSNAELSVLDTTVVLETLKLLDANSPAYSTGVLWLSFQSALSTDFLSRKIASLHMAGIDVSNDLLTLINSRRSDGGWGGDNDSMSFIIDTSLVLRSLKSINYSDQTIIQSAINYLIAAQNADGGWAFRQAQGDITEDSSVYMTAIVSMTLQQFTQTTSIATAVNKAKTYLISHQNSDGGFGEGGGTPPLQSPSTIYKTAYAYLALVGVTTDAPCGRNTTNEL